MSVWGSDHQEWVMDTQCGCWCNTQLGQNDDVDGIHRHQSCRPPEHPWNCRFSVTRAWHVSPGVFIKTQDVYNMGLWLKHWYVPLPLIVSRLSVMAQNMRHFCLVKSHRYIPPWGAADAEIKNPPGGSPGLSFKLPPFWAWGRNIALRNMLCLLPGPLAYSFLPDPVYYASFSPKPLQTKTAKCLKLSGKRLRLMSCRWIVFHPWLSPFHFFVLC